MSVPASQSSPATLLYDEPQYKKLITAMCNEHQISLIRDKVGDWFRMYKIGNQDRQRCAECVLAAEYQEPELVVDLWLDYLTYLRRNIDFKCEKEVATIRATFSLAWYTLGRQFGVLADSNCEILQMWGHLEYGPLNDLAKGKELWTTVMDSADNVSKTSLWMEFAHLELRKGVDWSRE